MLHINYLHDLFIPRIENPSYELRNIATDIQISKQNSANSQKRFSFREAKLWNSPPTEIKSVLTKTNLKHSL